MYLSRYYLTPFKAVLVSLLDVDSNNMSRLSVLKKVLLKQKQSQEACKGKPAKFSPNVSVSGLKGYMVDILTRVK